MTGPLRRILAPLLLVAAVASPGALAGTFTVPAQGDTWVTDRYSTRNFNGETAMRVNSNPVKRGLVRFEVGTLDGPVDRAILRLYAETSAPAGFRVNAIPATWNAGTVTHNTTPAPGALLATTAPFAAQGSWREIDVTAAVTGAGARAFLLTSPTASADVAFTTSEGGRAPELVITTVTAPASASPPTVGGTARAGQILTAQPGTWIGSTPMTFAHRWRRCSSAGTSCFDIAGATGTSYTLATADIGATIRVQVTATNAHGSAQATSAQTSAVQPAMVPPPAGGCSRADATGCAAVAGSKVSLVDERFNCREPLAAIAARNSIGSGPGKLPLIVEVRFTTFLEMEPAVVDLRENCVGDGDDATIDLVLQVHGDGRTIGGTNDAVKVRLTAANIQVTGFANCGPRHAGPDGLPNTSDDAHQDGVQIQGGDTIEFIDFEWGDWETSTATCQGAAGTFATGSVNNNALTDVACIRCKSVSCNHGMYLSRSDGVLVVDSKWRTGNPADREGLLPTGQIGLCTYGSPPCIVQEETVTSWVVLGNLCDRWPYGDDS